MSKTCLVTMTILLAAAAWQGCARTRHPALQVVSPTETAAQIHEPPSTVLDVVERPVLAERPEPRRSFFRLDKNVIHNAGSLGPFFSSLQDVARGDRRKVDVIHLGDSHVQADLMTTVLRESLQMEFGDAGRGLVFPHRVAHTNGPADIKSWSNVDWTSRRISKRGEMPVGASGHGLTPKSDGFWLKLGMDDDGGSASGFNRVMLFAGGGTRLGLCEHDNPRILETTFPELPPEYYTIRRGDYLGKIAKRYGTTVRRLKSINDLGSDRIYAGDRLLVRARGLRNGRLDASRFRQLGILETHAGAPTAELALDHARSTLFVHSLKARGKQASPLYGFYLENTGTTGVIVSGVGSNGARYRNFSAEPEVLDQLGLLSPDLVVISMGTNEATNRVLDPEAITASIDSVVAIVRARMPHAAIILTTPPDHLERRRLSNLKVRQVRRLIVSYAEEHGLAWWDLHEVMGGAGSMERWYTDGLAREDRIHFTAEGYHLQGELFVAALLRAYDRHISS